MTGHLCRLIGAASDGERDIGHMTVHACLYGDVERCAISSLCHWPTPAGCSRVDAAIGGYENWKC